MRNSIIILLYFIVLLASCSNQNPDAKQQSTSPVNKQAGLVDSSQKITLIRIPAFELYADSLLALGDSTTVETFTLSWQSDDLLCDQYDGSEGPMKYCVYRLGKSKKMLAEFQSGAFCQGDSEFEDYILFDLNGNYVYGSYFGMYQPSDAIFYNNGISVAGIQTPGEGEETYAPRYVSFEGTGAHTAPQDPITDKRHRVERRKEMLEKLLPTLTNQDEISEAKATLKNVEALLEKKENWEWKNICLLRNAIKGEATRVNRLNVPVLNKPDKAAKKAAEISYYDGLFDVVDISTDGKWYKISGTSFLDAKQVEGWIENKFLVPGIFEN